MAFAKAQKLEAPATPKGKKKVETVTVEGLHDYALYKALITNLESMVTVAETTVKDTMRSHFAKMAFEKGKVENFKGSEGTAVASLQCRKRSEASVLSAEERALLDQHKVPYGKKQKVVGTFAINPKYLSDEAMLDKAEKALAKAKLPDDFIVHQEEVTVYVVTDDTLEAVIEKGLVETLMDTVYTLAIRAKLSVEDGALDKALKALRKAL